MVASFPVDEDEEVMLVTNSRKLIRLPVNGIRIAGRVTQVALLNTEKTEVVSVTELKKYRVKFFMKQLSLYPGSFDPITNGHLDIIFRASKIVDTLIIGVAINEKKHLFDMTERTNLINEQLSINKKLSNTKVIALMVF